MPRGTKPKALALHEVDGTKRSHHKGKQLDPRTPIGNVPEHLDHYASWFWAWAIDQWKRMGTPPGSFVELEGMADYYSRWCHAKEIAPTGGVFIEEKSGNPKRHPASVESIQCYEKLRIMMASSSLSMEGWIRNAKPDTGAKDFFGPRLDD